MIVLSCAKYLNQQQRIITVKEERIEGGGNINRRAQLSAVVFYLALSGTGNFAWEIAHVPLYTIWSTGTLNELIFSVVHCTIGDMMIAFSALIIAIILSRSSRWPATSYWHVAGGAIILGVFYTGFSEWLNLEIRKSWEYSNLMPVLDVFGFVLGISPLAQWIVVPGLVFWLIRQRLSSMKISHEGSPQSD